MKQRSDGGYVVVWMLVVIATLVAAASSIHFADEGASDPTMRWIFAAAFAVATWGVWVESRRDLYAAAGFTLVVALVVGMITGAIVVYGTSPHPVAAAAAVISALAFVGCAVLIWQTQHGGERLPDLLRRRFHRGSIYELDGVQLVAIQSATELEAGDTMRAEFFAQNCWDADRRLRISLEPELRLSLDRGRLAAPAETSVNLPAGGVVRTTIPIIAPAAKGSHALSVRCTIDGSGGVRVRKRRAQGITQMGTGMTIAALLAGIHFFGRGLRVRVRVVPTSGARRGGEAMPAASEVLYQPTAQELAAAAT